MFADGGVVSALEFHIVALILRRFSWDLTLQNVYLGLQEYPGDQWISKTSTYARHWRSLMRSKQRLIEVRSSRKQATQYFGFEAWQCRQSGEPVDRFKWQGLTEVAVVVKKPSQHSGFESHHINDLGHGRWTANSARFTALPFRSSN
jgi:hypothetical protein